MRERRRILRQKVKMGQDKERGGEKETVTECEREKRERERERERES